MRSSGQQQLQAQLQQQAWAVLLGGCAWQDVLRIVHDDVYETYKDAPSELAQSIADNMLKIRQRGGMCKASREQQQVAKAYTEQLEELGVDDELLDAVEHVVLLHTAAAEQLAGLRLHAFEELGFDTTAWVKQEQQAQADDKRRLAAARLRRKRRKLLALRTAALGAKKMELVAALLGFEHRGVDLLPLGSDDEMELDELAQQDQQRLPALPGAAAAAESASADEFRAAFVSAASAGGDADGGAADGAEVWCVEPAVHAGLSALRRLALRCSAQFAPLVAWHGRWSEHRDELAQQSHEWWNSEPRRKLAAAGCRGQRPAPSSQAAAAAAGQKASRASSNGSSSSSEEWHHGGYDFCSSCPLCRQEQQAKAREQQQQQQQQQSSTGDVSCSPSTPLAPSSSQHEAVPYSDPFMWRRLLWQLLGKLSPEAQAFYAQYTAACPHCPDPLLWHCVRSSLLNSLWSSPAGDAVEQQMSRICPLSCKKNAERGVRLQLYARALNASFMSGKVQQQAAMLVAQQLLLALSPLHAQLLPRPETAFLCPSSFPAAVGKALAGQLLSRPVLDMFRHDQAHLAMWHVWWHIGLRRYAGMRGQGQQLAQVLHAAAATSNWMGCQLPAAELDELYLNPDAKVYAVHFAARQLSGMAGTAISSSSSSGGSNGSSSMDGLGLARDTALASEAALAAAEEHVRNCRRDILQKASRKYFAAEQFDPDTGEPLLNAECQLLLRTLSDTLDDLERHLGWEDLRALLPAMAGQARHHLLQPAGIWQLQVRPVFSTDAGATAVVKHLWRSERADAEAERGSDSLASSALCAKGMDVETNWELCPMRVRQPSTDVEEAALQPPVPIDALLQPDVWLDWHDEQLDWADQCDSCEDAVHGAQLQVCCGCHVVRYCSQSCLERNAAAHAVVCRQLASARRRYSRCANRPKPCTTPSCSHTSNGAPWGTLLQPVMQPEPEPWCFSSSQAGAALQDLPPGVVPLELYMEKCRGLFNQTVQAAAQASNNSSSSGGSSSRRDASSGKQTWLEPWTGYGL
ncbi:hypothetical protein COO60DRAFT_88069 [Scenedesmus sp. NREL 46B-D3]|nr:hypothetical protein COO60DRAFT_88069 [Scenedesmus sp. NREL 46B-D3]